MAVCTWLSWSQIKWPHNTIEDQIWSSVVTMAMCRASPHLKGDLEIYTPCNCKKGVYGVGEVQGEESSHTGWVADRAKAIRHHYGVLWGTQRLAPRGKYQITHFIRIPNTEFTRVPYTALQNNSMWLLFLIRTLVRTTSNMVPSYSSENQGTLWRGYREGSSCNDCINGLSTRKYNITNHNMMRQVQIVK